MPKITPAALGKILKAEKLEAAPVYLLYGLERKRVSEAAGKLKEKLIGQVGADGYYRFVRLGDGQDEISAGELVAQLNTVSMFGGGKLVWLGPVESIAKESAETLSSYIQDPNPQTVFIITFVPPKKEKRLIDAFERSSVVKAAMETGVAVRFDTPRGADVFKWVDARFKSNSVSIGRIATERLVELCDKDLERLGGEVEKLSAYKGYEGEVGLDDVEFAVGDHKENKMWDLLDAVRHRRAGEATAALENLMEHNLHHQAVLKSLSTELVKLALAADFRSRGESFESFHSAIGGSPYPAKKVWSDASRWTIERARDALWDVLTANLDIMKRRATPDTAMFDLVANLCGEPSSAGALGR